MRTEEQIYDLLREQTSRQTTNSTDMSTATDITASPTSGEKIVLTDLLISTDTNMNVIIQEETSGTEFISEIYVAANVPVLLSTLAKMVKAAVANKKIQAKASVAGNITVTAWWYSEA